MKVFEQMPNNNARFLITGATGTVGRELVKLLLDEGQPVAAVTRNPGTAALPDGVQLVRGDPSHPSTLTSALHGVEAIFVIPRAVGESTAELVCAAAAQGVPRVVVASSAT